MELELVDDQQRGPADNIIQIDGGLLGHPLPGEGQQIPHDPSGSLRLVVNDPQVLPRQFRMRRPLEQELSQSGDRGEWVVELVSHA
jgi:hypothetical protein